MSQSHFRTEAEIQELIALARLYCEVRADCAEAKAEGRLSAADEQTIRERLERIDKKLELLKSNNELDRRRARAGAAVIPMARFQKKVAR
jgi:hypothetical protein